MVFSGVVNCCQLLLLFSPAFFSVGSFFSILFFLLLAPYLCEICETRIFGKNITPEKRHSLFFHYQTKVNMMMHENSIIPWNVQFMNYCQYIMVDQSQKPVECSGVHDVEWLSVSKRFELICINSVRKPLKGNVNRKNILREGTHHCESKIQKCKGSTLCRILNPHIPKMDWEWWANPVWNIKWAWKQ